MFNRKSLYLFLLSATICSLFFSGLFLYVLVTSLIVIIIINRGLFITLKANKEFINKNDEVGYRLLSKAYKAGGLPIVVLNGYIYISMKLGYTDNAYEAIEKILSAKNIKKLKDGQKNMILTQKALYLWQTDRLKEGLDLLLDLYSSGYKTTTFYGNLGCLLYLDSQLEKALDICLEAYDYGSEDKVTLDNLVAIYIKLNNWDLAKKYFDELMILNPTFCEAYYHGALIEFNNNNFSEADLLLNRAKEFNIFKISSISTEDINTLSNLINEKLDK